MRRRINTVAGYQSVAGFFDERRNDGSRKTFFIKSEDCSLSELASRIKEIVENTQDSEYPNFKLLPYAYDFGKENKAADQPAYLEGKFLFLWGVDDRSIHEMIRLLPENITIEDHSDFGLDLDLLKGARITYESLDKMIHQLQIEGGKEMENKGNAAKEQEKAIGGENVQEAVEEKKEHKVYLSLPPIASKVGFQKMIENLKEAGAKFDSYNKHWYITPDADFNKFKGFLGLPYEIVNERGKELRAKENERKANQKQEEKGSVKDKLEKNKASAKKNMPEKKEPEHNREESR